MIACLLTALLLLQQPDTLQAAAVTAVRSVSPATETATREVLQRKDNLADAIRDFSGVQLRDYGGVGGLKTINVRSLGSAHTAVFLDGVPIDNAQNMQVDLGRIATDGLEAVELYQGQRSQLLQTAKEYGSASALHLSTAAPTERKLRLRVKGGAFGTFAPQGSYETTLGKWLSTRIQAGFTHAHGQYRFHASDYQWDTVMLRENSDLKAFRADGALYFRPGNGQYSLRVSWYDADRGIPGPVYKQAARYTHSQDRQTDRSLSVQAGGEQVLSPTLRLLVKAKYARDFLRYLDVSELDPGISAQWDYLLQSAYLSTALGWQAAEWLHLSAAVDGQRETLRAQVNPERNNLFTAVSAALLLDPWRVSAALQYQLSDGAGRYSFLSPSLLLDWHPREDWEFGALFKRSCRLPSFNDLYYTNVNARALKPESVWQAAARWSWDRRYGRWHFRAREELYFNLVEDKLVAVPNGSLFRWSMYNIGLVRIFGDQLVASAAYQGKDWEAGGTARYDYQRAADGETWWQIPYIPIHSGSFQLYARYRSFRADVSGSWTGERLNAASTRPEARLAPWTLWDATLSWEALRGLRLSLELHNLLDTQYEIIQQYPMPGFHVMGCLSFEW
ncbi:MAG: TonB-dependent receptor [Bacteroidales bacterium]|nr:TonB-dependent receptor [Bacteroidales bacterium]